nr:hypothetical protein [Chlamydiota bacterium]
MSDFAISPQMVHTQGNNPRQSEGFSFRDLLNPISLIGRVCENWKPIATVVLVIIGIVTSIFSGSLLHLFLFVALGGVASILIRDIRDLGTYKDLNKDHADVNDDQVLITLNLAAEVDGLDLVRQRLETQNAQLDEAVTGHVETNARQGEIVGQQAEQLKASTEERAGEREQFKETIRGHKRHTLLLEEHSKALEAESARVKVEVDELL